MKKLILISLIGLVGCNGEFKTIDTTIIKGVVSATDEGHRGRASRLPKIYVQSSRKTIDVDIPFANENDFKVGDTVVLIVKTVEKTK